MQLFSLICKVYQIQGGVKLDPAALNIEYKQASYIYFVYVQTPSQFLHKWWFIYESEWNEEVCWSNLQKDYYP